MSKVRTRRVSSVLVTVALTTALVAAPLATGCRGEPPRPSTNTDVAPALPASAAPAPDVAPAANPAALTDATPVAQPSSPPSEPGPAVPEPPRVPQTQHSGRVDGPIPYLVVEPAVASDSLPVVIALHGRGDRAENFARVIEELAMPVRTLVGRPPVPFGITGGRQWFVLDAPDAQQQVAQRVADVVTLMDRVKATYPGAPKPILLGFSQGAMLALQVAARHPDRVGGVVALSGALPLTEGNVKAEAPVPMLLSVGAHDTMVRPERTRAAAAALEALGHRPEVFEFQGAHQIPDAVLAKVRAFVSGITAPPPASPAP